MGTWNVIVSSEDICMYLILDPTHDTLNIPNIDLYELEKLNRDFIYAVYRRRFISIRELMSKKAPTKCEKKKFMKKPYATSPEIGGSGGAPTEEEEVHYK